jgi:serine/threonine protein kinase
MPVVPLEPDDPHVLGRYRLVGRLGEGGQGIVFLGEDEAGRHVAIKVLKTGADQRARERLAREMISAQRVAPFCTARVLESSVDGSRPFVVSEFVDGPSVQQRVAEHGPLREGELDRLVVGPRPRSPPSMARVSSTAISSRRTCSSARTDPGSSTSVSPAPSTRAR